MQLYEMQVSKTAIYRTAPARIPKGILGAAVKLSFSPEWEGLTKTVVFRAGEVVKDVLDVEDVAVIPSECTREAGVLLEIGVYGVDGENTVAIPTLWAAIGRVTEAADPSGDTTTDPQLPVWAQLLEMVTQLEKQGAAKEEVARLLEMVTQLEQQGATKNEVARLLEMVTRLEEQGATKKETALLLKLITQLEQQGVTQREIEQALRDFFGGERPTGKTTPEGGEIFNDYESNQALAPHAKADGAGNRAGIHGYKLLAVEKSGEGYLITAGDAELESKARENYAPGDLLCVDGKGHFYDCLRITALTTDNEDNSIIAVSPTDDRDLSNLAVDASKDQWENWVYVLKKPNAGEPAKVAYGAYAGGVGSVAIGYGAFAHGAENQSIGKFAYTAGRKNVAHYAGYAKGYNNKALGENASAEGSSNTASGVSAHAEGTKTTASGNYSHAEGSQTVASGLKSHAEGDRTTASGAYAHAEGASTVASGEKAHAQGSVTTASGLNAHAEGRKTKASGAQSHAEGNETIASGANQHVQGKFNVEDSTKAHIVGGGTSDTDRKNIYTLDWNGNAEFAGKIYSAGVEAAPGGFGLGSNCVFLPDYDWNKATANGWYAGKVNTPDGSWWFGTVSRMNEEKWYVHQRVCSQFGATVSPIFAERTGSFHLDDNGDVIKDADGNPVVYWNEWEYINPPMMLGIEYRTTERYNGKPVYTSLIGCGVFPAASTKTVSHDKQATQILRYAGRTPYFGCALPYWDGSSTYAIAQVFVHKSSIIVECRVSTWSDYNCYVQMWYTKD